MTLTTPRPVRRDTGEGNTAMWQGEREFNLHWAYIHTGRVGYPIRIEHEVKADQFGMTLIPHLPEASCPRSYTHYIYTHIYDHPYVYMYIYIYIYIYIYLHIRHTYKLFIKKYRGIPFKLPQMAKEIYLIIKPKIWRNRDILQLVLATGVGECCWWKASMRGGLKFLCIVNVLSRPDLVWY